MTGPSPEFARGQTALIVGLGSAGRRHMRNLHALGVERFVLCRSGRSTMGPVDDAPAGTVTESTIEAALSHRPTLAVISTPTALHLDPALAAAEAGCHLLIEKPVSHTLDGLERLRAAVESRGLTAAVGCQFRFHPLLESLRERLRVGRLGTVHSARAVYREYLPGWHPWEDHRRTYPAKEALGGGAIRTLIHAPDALRWLFGPIEAAHAVVSRCADLGTDVPDDAATLALGFASGVQAGVELDFVTRPPRNSLTVFGTEGTASLDFLDGGLVWTNPQGDREVEQAPAGFGRDDLFMALARDFLACAESGRAPRTTLDDGIEVLSVLLAARDLAIEARGAAQGAAA